MENLINKLKSLIGNENVKTNVNIKKYLTFHVDTIAKILIEVYNKSTLIKVLEFLYLKKVKYVCIGGGSNILFKNRYVKDVVIHLCDCKCKIYKRNTNYYLSAFAGCRISNIINKCKQNSFSCLEWAVGIPASLGGTTIMNMSSGDEQIKSHIKSVTYYKDGKVKTCYKNDLFFYRNSWYKQKNCVIISVTLIIQKVEKLKLQNDLLFYYKKKAQTQPLNKYSCGSVFKNTNDYKVAKLIEDAGLKGVSIGGASISNKHSNFIINVNNSTSRDIIKLIKLVKNVIYKKYKVKLEEEIVII